MTLLATVTLLAVPSLPLVIATLLLWRRTCDVGMSLAPFAALPGLAVAVTGWPAGIVDLPWLLVGTELGVDPIRRLFLFFTAALWLAGGHYAHAYHAHDPRRVRMWSFFLYAMAGNLGLIIAADAVTFYVGFLGMSLAAYGLIVHADNDDARRAGRIYLVLVVLGEALILPALWMATQDAASLSMPDIVASIRDGGATLFWLLAIGLGIKAALVPLHVWLPLAHPVAPTPASALLSGAIVKAGVLGWLLLLPLGELAWPDRAAVFVCLGLVGAFGGAVVGCVQSSPKAVLAYSSVSQLGLMTAALGMALHSPEAAAPAILAVGAYAMHHAFAKCALFMGVGCMQAASTARGRRLVLLALLLPAAALAGLPLTSGSVAKTALKDAAYVLPAAWQSWLDIALPLAAVGTTLLMARFIYVMARPGAAAGHAAPRLFPPWIALLIATAAMSLMPIALESGMIWNSLALTAWWPGIWPVALGVGLAWLAWKLRPRAPHIPEGDVLWPVVAVGAAVWQARPRDLAARAARYGAALRNGRQRAADRVANAAVAAESRLGRWSVLTGLATALLLACAGLLALASALMQ